MRITIVLLAFAAIVISSCRKTRSQVEVPQLIDSVLLPPFESPEYMKATPGNYWVYREYRIYDNGVEEPLNQFDTARVEKDTIIGKRKYRKMLWPQFGGGQRVEYITDS